MSTAIPFTAFAGSTDRPAIDASARRSGPPPQTLRQIVLLGTFPPQQCGIATYTADVLRSLEGACPGAVVFALAVSKGEAEYDYPPEVAFEIRDHDPASYVRAADYLNHVKPDVLCVQHDYGLFGGAAGSHLFALLENCGVPVVTVMHTLLADPSPEVRAATLRLLRASDRMIVMTHIAADLLRRVYGAPVDMPVDIIPHGIPDISLRPPSGTKRGLGLENRFVLLTFGLLSPGKGIEHAIDAMPEIVRRDPSAIYLILGATHPCLLLQEGETCRESLIARTRSLGVESHVQFVNRYVDIATLSQYLSAADVCVTPYLNEARITSGTLAYASGAGKPVVSTPYWHARELITPERGFIVPFGDSPALARAVCRLITEPALRESMRANAWQAGRASIWPEVGKRFAASCGAAVAGAAVRNRTRRAVSYPEAAECANSTTGTLISADFSRIGAGSSPE